MRIMFDYNYGAINTALANAALAAFVVLLKHVESAAPRNVGLLVPSPGWQRHHNGDAGEVHRPEKHDCSFAQR